MTGFSIKKRRPAPSVPRFETHPLAESRVFAFYAGYGNRNPFRWHYHAELELILWTTARGIRFVGDSIENIDRGDLCLVGPNLPHTWSIDFKPGQTEYNIQVQFLPGCLGKELMASEELRPLGRLVQRAQRGLKITGATRPQVSETLLGIARKKPSPGIRFGTILRMLMELAESRHLVPLASTAAGTSISPRVDRSITKVLDFIQSRLDEGVPQSEAAALLRMSPAAFSRFFRRHLGRTYIGFVNEIRIGKACMALLQTDQTISEVAYASGYQNLSHFNEQFHRYKRMTPTQYRELVRKE